MCFNRGAFILVLHAVVFGISSADSEEPSVFERGWERVGTPEREKRWSLDDQKKAAMNSLPFGIGQEDEPETESDVTSWKDARAKSKEALSTYVYPKAIDEMSHKLQVVGHFLVTHKYFEKDWRFEDQSKRPGMEFPSLYMKHFPIPRLKTFHPDVASACSKGVIACIEEIFGIAILTWSAQDRALGAKPIADFTEEAIIYPFQSRVKLFNYRVTAIYYMCWFTMREEKQLAHFRGRCFDFDHDYQAVNKQPWPVDYRSNDKMPFDCALLAFCPDVCCGRPPSEGPMHSLRDCWNSRTNPCNAIYSGVCRIPFIENVNFEDLIRNRINYTCECGKTNPGFEWNSQFELCVDKDECYDQTVSCHKNEVCWNTVGSYECRCRYGYLWDESVHACARHHRVKDMAKAIVTSAPSKPGREATGYTLIDDLNILWELFSGSSRPTSSSAIAIALLISVVMASIT